MAPFDGRPGRLMDDLKDDFHLKSTVAYSDTGYRNASAGKWR
jgi:hypothetical protein